MTKLDKAATIQNVKDLLSEYHHFRNLAKGLELLGSAPTFDELPEIINLYEPLSRIDALQLKLNCDNTIKMLTGDAGRLLTLKYVQYGNSERVIVSKLGISSTTYYDHLKTACLSFAELFGLLELQEYLITSPK